LANKLSLLFVILIAFVVTFAACAVLVEYWHPNTGTITTASLELYINTTLYTNTTGPDWGACDPGFIYTFENCTVRNVGNTPLNVTLIPHDLPVGWTLTWLGNETLLQPNTQVEASLDLSIPVDATEWGTWRFYIRGEQT